MQILTEPMWIATMTTLIGPLCVAVVGYFMNKTTRSMKRDSDRNAKVGKLRAQREQVLDQYGHDVDDFAISLGTAYCRGNDKDVIQKKVDEIKVSRKEAMKKAEDISLEIINVYEEDEVGR